MQVGESAWVKYITMIEQDWKADVLSLTPRWHRTNTYLREQEEMLMSREEVSIWEKVHGVSIAAVRKIGKRDS